MNINEEGKFYASMVRKFRTEHKSKNLHGFCKEQKVSYTKMLHCLRNDSYRKPTGEPVPSVGESGLHPLVVETEDNAVLETSNLSVASSSKLEQALTYMTKHWEDLIAYVKIGSVQIDNNCW